MTQFCSAVEKKSCQFFSLPLSLSGSALATDRQNIFAEEVVPGVEMKRQEKFPLLSVLPVRRFFTAIDQKR